MNGWYKAALFAVLAVLVIAWAKPPQKSSGANLAFQTVAGTGPDKWASVWLVRTQINPSPVTIASTDAGFSEDAISFDTDSSVLTRSGTSTTYTAFLDAHSITDPVAIKMGKIIHDIEINAWNPNREIESLQVENAFRQMQIKFGRDKVTQVCYMKFFSSVADAIQDASITLRSDVSRFIPAESCLDNADDTALSAIQQTKQELVPELDLSKVLDSISANKKVVFLDTREAFEFGEGHIPGAINMTLRQINSSAAAQLAEADLVIAYCVKDFRGFEAARALRKFGVNAVIMNPYGIKGWRNAGLPVVGSRGLPESEATTAMQSLVLQHLEDQDASS